MGIRAKVKTGKSGDMTVLVNGEPVFNYKKEGSMPAISELLRRVTAAESTA